MTDNRDDLLGQMYDGEAAPLVQPELKTEQRMKIDAAGGIAALEKIVREQQRLLEDLRTKAKRQEVAFNRHMNNALKRISQLETQVSNLENRKYY